MHAIFWYYFEFVKLNITNFQTYQPAYIYIFVPKYKSFPATSRNEQIPVIPLKTTLFAIPCIRITRQHIFSAA